MTDRPRARAGHRPAWGVCLALCGALVLPARADTPPAEAPARSALERSAQTAVLRYKLLSLEQRRFDQQFPLAGKAAGEAVEALRAAGYACTIERPDSPPAAAKGAAAVPARGPGVSCARPSTALDDLCKERRVRMAVDWQDPSAPAGAFDAQLASSRVTDRQFRCD